MTNCRKSDVVELQLSLFRWLSSVYVAAQSTSNASSLTAAVTSSTSSTSKSWIQTLSTASGFTSSDTPTTTTSRLVPPPRTTTEKDDDDDNDEALVIALVVGIGGVILIALIVVIILIILKIRRSVLCSVLLRPAYRVGSIKQCCMWSVTPSDCLSVCLSVCPISQHKKVNLGLWLLRDSIRIKCTVDTLTVSDSPRSSRSSSSVTLALICLRHLCARLINSYMLEVETTGHRRDGSEAVAGAVTEAFARWLHFQQRPDLQHTHGMPPSNCRRRSDVSYLSLVVVMLTIVCHTNTQPFTAGHYRPTGQTVLGQGLHRPSRRPVFSGSRGVDLTELLGGR